MSTTFRRPARWRARLLILAALYFTFLGGSLVTDLSFWPRVLHHLLVSAILAGWAISLWRRGVGIPSTPLDIPIATVVGSWIIATVFSTDPRVSIEALWQVGVLAAFFYILVDMMRSWGTKAVLEPIFFAAGVVVMMAAFEFVSWYFGLSWWLPTAHLSWLEIGGLNQPIPPSIYRLQYTLSIATFLAGYLSLLMPVGLAWAITTTSGTVRRGLFLWLAGAAVAMVLAFSRGGLLSLGVSLAVFTAMFVAGSDSWRERASVFVRDWRVWAGVAVLIAVVAVIVVIGLRGDPFGHAAGDKMRFDLLQSAWNIGLGHPLTGVGPYGFGRAMRQFRDPTVTGDYFSSSHNIPLQVFAESGLLGVAALAGLLIAGGRIAWLRWRVATGAERIRIAGVAAALAGFSAQNLGDTLVNIPVLLPWLAFGAYLVAPMRPEPGRYGQQTRRVILAAISAAIVFSIAGWAVSDLAQYHSNKAVQLEQKSDLRTALTEIELAVQIDPAMGYYAAQRAQYLGELAATDKTYVTPALDAYQTALHFENTYALMRANHALLLRESGDLRAAAAEMKAAVSFQPDDPRYQFALADINDQLGNSEDALAAYQLALKLRPDRVGSGYWDKTELRKQARDLFVKASGTKWSPEQLASLDSGCWVSSPTGARADMSADPLCQGEIALRILDDPAGALPWLDRVVADNKAGPTGYLLRAEARRQLGDTALAEKDARTALFLGESHAYVVLGRLAEAAGRDAEAERDYRSNPPLNIQSQGWDVAVYQRRGLLTPLPLLDAPGPSRYDFEAWFALLDLYNRQGRAADAAALRGAIMRLDPYLSF